MGSETDGFWKCMNTCKPPVLKKLVNKTIFAAVPTRKRQNLMLFIEIKAIKRATVFLLPLRTVKSSVNILSLNVYARWNIRNLSLVSAKKKTSWEPPQRSNIGVHAVLNLDIHLVWDRRQLLRLFIYAFYFKLFGIKNSSHLTFNRWIRYGAPDEKCTMINKFSHVIVTFKMFAEIYGSFKMPLASLVWLGLLHLAKKKKKNPKESWKKLFILLR